MIVLLLIGLVVAVLAIITLTFLLGFRLGGQSWFVESQRIRAEAAASERELHTLTRTAFEAMAEAASRRRR